MKSDCGIFETVHDIPGLSIGIIGKMCNRIDYGRDREPVRSDERILLSGTTGLQGKNIIFLNQVHGDDILSVEAYPERDLVTAGDADGIVTNLPGLCLVIRTADCVPVFACDPVNRIIGAAHSGWKGTKLAISAKLVREMKKKFNSSPADIRIFILPSIGPESYTVNDDVARFFSGYVNIRKNTIYLSLWDHIEDSLTAEGISRENIFNHRICNHIRNGDFFSHRKGDIGRNLNFGYFTG